MVAAIEIRRVSKRFRLYHEHYSSLKERMIHFGRIPYEDFVALVPHSADDYDDVLAYAYLSGTEHPPTTGVTAAFLAPFLLWDAAAFVRDTVVFLIGGGTDAYPINGFGLSAILLSGGVIHGARDAFPFALLELIAAGAVWTAAWVWLRRRVAIADVLILMGLVFASVLFVSRYFHDTHLLLGVELILAGLAARAWRTA